MTYLRSAHILEVIIIKDESLQKISSIKKTINENHTLLITLNAKYDSDKEKKESDENFKEIIKDSTLFFDISGPLIMLISLASVILPLVSDIQNTEPFSILTIFLNMCFGIQKAYLSYVKPDIFDDTFSEYIKGIHIAIGLLFIFILVCLVMYFILNWSLPWLMVILGIIIGWVNLIMFSFVANSIYKKINKKKY